MSDPTYVAGKSQPVYFLNKLWEASITDQVTPEIEIDLSSLSENSNRKYLFTAYALSANGSGYIGYIQRLRWVGNKGWKEDGHCLYAELPSCVWEHKSLQEVLLDIVKGVKFEDANNSGFAIRRYR